MEYGLASSVSDQAAGEVSLPIRFRQRRLDNSGLRGRFQPKYEEKHLFLVIGGLIGFDYSSQGGQRKSDPKLIWGMSG